MARKRRTLRQEKAALRQRQRDIAERSRLRETARFSLLLDALTTAITPLEFSPPKIIQPQSNEQKDEEVAVLMLSDLHFGKKTSKFNLDIARRRFTSIIDGAIKIAQLHRRAYPINKLVILWCGDLVDGSGIYKTHAHNVDANIVNQIFSTAPFVVEQIARLSTVFDNVECYAVSGNHGRLSSFAHDYDNFDTIYCKTLEIATSNLKNVSWQIPLNKWYQVISVNNTKILIFHGHQIKMHLNLPWYSLTTRISRWATSKNVKSFDVSCSGHFHTSSCLRWGDKTIFTNGTIVAQDEFALQHIGLESSESQWFFGIHARKGVTWRYEIRPH